MEKLATFVQGETQDAQPKKNYDYSERAQWIKNKMMEKMLAKQAMYIKHGNKEWNWIIFAH